MKTFLLVTLVSFYSICSSAQKGNNVLSRNQPVTITDWDKRAIFFMPNFWEMAKPQLQKTMGDALVDSVVKYSSTEYWPKGFYTPIFDDKKTTAPNRNTLKMYKVASFINSNNTIQVVLWLPKGDNKNWMKRIEWKNDLFFVIPETAVKRL